MTDKPKSKVEDIARRREWMDRLTVYLVLVLIGLIVIAFDAHDSLEQFVWTLGFLLGISVAFVVGLLTLKNLQFLPGAGTMALVLGSCAGIVVAALVSGFLERLVGRLPW